MSEHSITVDGVSKRYVIGGPQLAATSFREMLTGVLRAPLDRLRGLRGEAGEDQTFWALKDVSFEVEKGTVVGIIGANGAGKSTLLKVLSRITEPTAGRITYRGRLATLLEVGTGFHPELSGRENIFLNGAILGMTRHEIRRRFDAIVDFADVALFLDTPVKRYSSGMYVRLAFAVAAHMDPDILVVDEVLSVGDAAFQKKCLNKMSEVSEGGRTVLFVSHNLDAVQRLCQEAIYLKAGSLVYRGAASEAIARYLEGGQRLVGSADLAAVAERWGTGRVRARAVSIEHTDGGAADVLMAGCDYRFVIDYECKARHPAASDMMVSIEFADVRGTTVWLVSSALSEDRFTLRGGAGTIECSVSDFNLAPGDYSLTLYLGQQHGETFDCLNNVLTVAVAGGDFFGTGHPGFPEHCRTLTRSTWMQR